MKIESAVLVVSDRSAAGEREDESGPAAREALNEFTDVTDVTVVPDDYTEIRSHLLDWAEARVDVVFTLGGTGLSPRDVTPEATESVIDKKIPALTTALLFNGLLDTPKAMLTRGVAGVRGRTLIVNLPGNPDAVRSGIEYLKDVLPHAVEVIRGTATE
jgi:molybdenum cofactor synthesis domain-containing protein